MSFRSTLAKVTPRPLKRVEYDILVNDGAFENERVELIDGILVTMSPQKSPHALAIQHLTELLVLALTGRAFVRIQLPLAASDDSEPEPDVAVVPRVDYADGHPTTALLVIEVADESLRKDRDVKGPLYAAAGYPEYWIVNLARRVVEVYRDPRDGRYQSVNRIGPSGSIALVAFPDVSIRIADFLR